MNPLQRKFLEHCLAASDGAGLGNDDKAQWHIFAARDVILDAWREVPHELPELVHCAASSPAVDSRIIEAVIREARQSTGEQMPQLETCAWQALVAASNQFQVDPYVVAALLTRPKPRNGRVKRGDGQPISEALTAIFRKSTKAAGQALVVAYEDIADSIQARADAVARLQGLIAAIPTGTLDERIGKLQGQKRLEAEQILAQLPFSFQV